jgi:CRISPR-associated exonuclease Cas4
MMIRVSDVSSYMYCPRTIYFESVLHVPRHSNPLMDAGRELHEELTKKEGRRKDALYYDKALQNANKSFHVALESKNLGIRGVLDCLIKTKSEFVPVDYKLGSSKGGAAHRGHKYQLACYALLVEECFDASVRRCYVHYEQDGVDVRIDFNDEVRRFAIRAIEDVRRIISSEVEPPATKNPAKCTACDFRRYCDGCKTNLGEP